MRILQIILYCLTFGLLSSAANAQIFSFEDASGNDNIVITLEVEGNGPKLISRSGNVFSTRISDFEVGELLQFEIEFYVPDNEGSEAPVVRGAQTMRTLFHIRVTEALLKRDVVVPVYYFDEVGARGFAQIDPISYSREARVFEQFFKAAQMTEHYYLRMGTYDTPEFRRAFRLWRDAAYFLATRKYDWFLMAPDIEVTSLRAFGDSTSQHEATLKYFAEANSP